ncbi:hypothetical protein KQH49_00700 [Mycetohabitans sp. B5]|nr:MULTISPECIES: hypothetical protein [Mycetohabitans]MCG1053558.1 hypothetical protein [Mycetohabitans sp. B5]
MTKSKIRIQNFLPNMPLFSALAACEIDRLALGATRVQLTRGLEFVERRHHVLPLGGVITLIAGSSSRALGSSDSGPRATV